MGRIVVTEFISLDGVIEDPGGAEDFKHGGWTFAFNTGEEGEKMNGMPKYVVSSTLGEAEWSNSTVLRGDVAEEVGKLKQEVGGTILVAGSAQLAQALVEHGLVDEIRLMVFPVVLGAGKRLFGESSDKTTLRLAGSKTVGDGVTILTYEPAPVS